MTICNSVVVREKRKKERKKGRKEGRKEERVHLM